MTGDESRRLERIEAQMDEILVRLERIDSRSANHADQLAAVFAEVGGVEVLASRGGRPSLRDRLHALEDDSAAARLGTQLLAEQKARARARWTTPQKVALFAFAAVGAASSLLRLLGIGG